MTNRLRGRKLQQRREGWFRYHPLCVHCDAKGRVTPATELDHIKPLHEGGEDNDPDNWQGLCADCHRDKTAKDMGYRPKHQVGADGWPIEQESK
jgi:5-methylcytosine-specific restriction protein A